MKLTANERAYVDLRKEIRRQDSIEAERMASQQLWKDCSTEDWCQDAASAQHRLRQQAAQQRLSDQIRIETAITDLEG